MGTAIASVLEGIRDDAYKPESGFEAAVWRPHQDWGDYFTALKAARTSG